MIKKIMWIVAITPLMSYADTETGYMDESNVPITFQRIDSAVGIGAAYMTGSLFGSAYSANGLALTATKLFSNNLWLNFNAEAAYNTSLVNGNQNFLNGDVGYAFNIGNRFQIIPNLQIQRMQVGGGSSTGGTANAVATNEVADIHLELVANKHLLFFADGGYGVSQFNVTSNGFTAIGDNSINNSSGGVLQANAGLGWKPVSTVPWAFKGQYIYQNYSQGNFGSINGYILSTGIAF